MLPDGLHKRSEDWTSFRVVLKDPSGELNIEMLVPPFEAHLFEFDESSAGWSDKGVGGVYIFDDKIIVADATSGEPMYEIANHAELDYTQMEPLFSCVLLPNGVPLGVRFGTAEEESSYATQVGRIKTGQSYGRCLSTGSVAVVERQSFCLSRVVVDRTQDVRRGARFFAVGLCGPAHTLFAFRPLLSAAIDAVVGAASDEERQRLAAALFDAGNAFAPPATASAHSRAALRFRAGASDLGAVDVNLPFLGRTVALRVPLTHGVGEFGETQLASLVRRFGAQTMTLFNAVLLQKRLLFLGNDVAAGDVCAAVQSISVVFSDAFPSVFARSHPYRNLTSLEFTTVPGYIAGAANPMFEQHTEWWDVCANLATAKVTTSPTTWRDPASSRVDNEFLARVQVAVDAHVSEDMLLDMFRGYVQHIVDVAMDVEEFSTPAAKQADVDANRTRVELFRHSPMFAEAQSRAEAARASSRLQSSQPLIAAFARKLRAGREMPTSEYFQMFDALTASVTDYDAAVELLSYFREPLGGVHALAAAVFHSDSGVRNVATRFVRSLHMLQGDRIRVLDPFVLHQLGLAM